MSILGNSLGSAGVNSAESIASEVMTLGREVAHTLSPNQIEFYSCSFELLDSSGETQGFLMFPVMPNSITISDQQISNISKTATGIVNIFNPTFVPKNITIAGTFGRKIRIITGKDSPAPTVKGSIPFFQGKLGKTLLGQELLVKTGYGLQKMLEAMIDNSWKLDSQNKPFILVFNNYAFNQSFIVEVMQKSFTQNTENTAIWFYSLEIKAVAPGSAARRNSKSGSADNRFLTAAIGMGITRSLTKIIKSITAIKWN